MKYRRLGKTELKISEVSLGTWQVGGRWGSAFDKGNATKILNEAIDLGVNFIDTADVYGDGLSEKIVGEVARARNEEVFVATKCGRRLNPHTNAEYQPQALRRFVEDSLRNTGLETLDLIQLHCPPANVYYRPEIFELFDKLKSEGKIRNLGVSVEKVEEALKAINFPNVTTVQIIYNMFRLRPAELFFKQAAEKDVGIIARVPLASGLLSGKINAETKFDKGDHRFFNRRGTAFDKGETFSGVDLQVGLRAVARIRELFPDSPGLAVWAVRWVLMASQVSCVIPGASRVEQLAENVKASDLEPVLPEVMEKIEEVYNELIRNPVHHLW